MKKIKKNSNSQTFLLIVFAGLLVVLSVVIYFNKFSNNFYNQPQASNISNGDNTTIYKSEDLKFKINVPSKFQNEEKFTTVLFRYGDSNIEMTRNGTNYSNLGDYIDDFDQKRNLIASEINMEYINGLEALSRMVEFPEENIQQKSYYIYVDNMVYVLSTSSASLFDDLDKIAQSFRYTP